jgi:hypothetical protein
VFTDAQQIGGPSLQMCAHRRESTAGLDTQAWVYAALVVEHRLRGRCVDEDDDKRRSDCEWHEVDYHIARAAAGCPVRDSAVARGADGQAAKPERLPERETKAVGHNYIH